MPDFEQIEKDIESVARYIVKYKPEMIPVIKKTVDTLSAFLVKVQLDEKQA